MDEEQGEKIERKLTKEIIRRYTNEIMGQFEAGFYKATRKAAPYFFGRLFNAAADDISNFFFPKTMYSLNYQMGLKYKVKLL